MLGMFGLGFNRGGWHGMMDLWYMLWHGYTTPTFGHLHSVMLTSLILMSIYCYTIFFSDFDLHPMHNNIALLYFKEEFQIESNVQPICLPKDLDELDRVSKEDCVGLGWGRDTSGKEGLLKMTSFRFD